MTDFFCLRTGDTLVPAHDSDLEQIKRLPKLQPLRVSVKRMRNVQFHRKYFALLNLAFDYWEPENQVGEKNFDRFRKDIIILCGFYEQYIRLDGSTRLQAKSISFASMDEDEFEDLYSKTIDVIIKYVMTNYSGDQLRSIVEQVEEYDG